MESDAAAGATRYRMLSVVRTHARSLAGGEEVSGAMRRLARLELDRIGPDHPTDRAWSSAMSVELDNVRPIVVTLGASQDAEELAIAQTLVGRSAGTTIARTRFGPAFGRSAGGPTR